MPVEPHGSGYRVRVRWRGLLTLSVSLADEEHAIRLSAALDELRGANRRDILRMIDANPDILTRVVQVLEEKKAGKITEADILPPPVKPDYKRLGDAADEWLAWLEAGGVSRRRTKYRPATIADYRSWLETFLAYLPQGRETDVTTLSAGLIERWRMSLKSQRTPLSKNRTVAATMSDATKNRGVAAIQALLSWMADSKRNSEYIPAPVRLEPLAEEKKIVRAQSSEDIAKVLDALSPAHWRAPAVLLIETGLRHGEARFLRKRDVELDEKVVRIQGIVKNEESVRVVPLTKAALDAIEPIVRKAKHKDDYLFPEMAKNRWGFAQAWSRACKKAVPMRVHDLRHSFAVRLLRGGADIATTRDVLGHASIETTDRYAREAASHETHERVRKALEGVAPY